MTDLTVAVIFVALADRAEKLVPFYIALFNQPPTIEVPQVYAEFHLPGLRLGIFQPKADQQQQFAGKSGSMSLCIEVGSLEAAIDHLNQIGCPPASKIMSASHGREIYIYDPAGNRLILHESLPKSS